MGLYLRNSAGNYVAQDSNADAIIDDADAVDGYHAVDLLASAKDKTANRALNTVYQNTTGRVLLVMVSCWCVVAAEGSLWTRVEGWVSPDNSTWYKTNFSEAYWGSSVCGEVNIGGTCFFVPPSWYYKVEVATSGSADVSSISLRKWIEATF